MVDKGQHWLYWQWRKLRHKHDQLPDGYGWTGPDRNFIMRCCRCGKVRLFGKAVEQHGPIAFGAWWHECLECALDSAAKSIARRGD